MRLSPCVLVQPDGWARGEREGYGGPRDVISLEPEPGYITINLNIISADEAAQDSAQASAHYYGSAATTTASATRGARPAPLLMETARAVLSSAASPARRGRGRAPGAYHLIPGAAAYSLRRPTSSAATDRRPAGS